MKDLFNSIEQYIEQQEQRIAALEARLLAAEQQAATANTTILALTQRLNVQQTKINELESRPIATAIEQTDEPEVEVELIVDDSKEETEETPAIEEITATPVVEEIKEEPADEESAENSTEETKVEETKEETKEEPKVEHKTEEKSQPQRPQQTSLFGAPVSDIRQAISIGDRFLFQRELFSGNGEQMQKMLDRLNACKGMDEAMQLVGQMAWDKESSTYELFMNVLRRRF